MASRMYEIAFEIAGKINSSFGNMFASANSRMRQLSQRTNAMRSELNGLERAQKQTTREIENSAKAYSVLKGSYSQSLQTLLQLNQRINNTKAALVALSNEKKSGAITAKEFSSRQAELVKQLKEANTAYTTLKTKTQSMKSEMQRLAEVEQQGKLKVEQNAKAYDELAKKLEKAELAQKKYSKAVALSERANSVKGKMQSGLMTATAAAVPFIGATAAGVQFDTAMAMVAKQVEGARNETGALTDIGLEARAKIMQASKDMMIVPDTMAKAFAMSARSGVKGMENIDRFARMGTMMGTAFEAPAEEVTENFAKIGSAMKIDLGTKEGIDQLEALADTVNYLDDQTNASGADIIEVLKRIGGTATALLPTLSRNSLAGLSTGLLQMGETSETAGTALNSLLTKVAAAPAQAKPFHEALAKVGISAQDLQAGALKDAEGTILGLFESIGKLDAGTRNDVLAELFGAEHIDTLSKISGNYADFVEIIKKGNSDAAKGSMFKEFEIMSKTAARQLEGVKASIARSAVSMSDVLMPSLLSAAQGFQSFMEKVQKLAEEHPNLTKFLVGGSAGFIGFAIGASAIGWAVSAAISPFAKFFGWATKIELGAKLASGATKAWAIAQRLLNVAMRANPIGLIITGIGLLIAGGVYLYNHWETVKAKALQLWETIRNNPLLALVAGPIGAVIAAGITLYNNFGTIKEAVSGLWEKFKEAFPSAAAFIENVGQKVGWLWDKLKAFWAWLSGGGGGGGGGEGELPQFASGGFANRPSIFGEAGLEAAIPIDGSPRSRGIWERVGELSGFSGGSETSIVYAPVIHAPGGDPGVIRQVLDNSKDDFFSRYQAMKHQQRRVSYGY
ncbi:phage tail tape measure protein [Pelotomaculum propionicicum]|uniref:Chromosome partition protein Smc n=1 Tax=Pelotomaculum propionicicum TaxID=258475 RepID=A0A4Y7RWS9_9FIRM|nr:phage tail tape measure protein [Pelotomaculum propionicicum]TEB13361.1 Chromosome partition protein Smc [Pelotomaculum propionicicum]